MIVKNIDSDSIFVVPEEFDDLLVLRRIIKKDDKIVGDTKRVIKKEREYTRPDRERVNIRIVLKVQKISLDDLFNRVHIQGIIIESNNNVVINGSHHSFYIKIGDGIKIIKKEWLIQEKKLMNENRSSGFLLISIEIGNCGVGIIHGTHLQILFNIHFGTGGKQYGNKFNTDKFFEEIKKNIMPVIKNNNIIIFGPGEIKRKFSNHFKLNNQKFVFKIVEGIESGGEDGIYIFIKSEMMKDIMKDSKLSIVTNIIDKIMSLASKKSQRFTMGLKQTKNANNMKSIESVVFTDQIIKNNKEDVIIDFLNVMEKNGVMMYYVDNTTDVGLRVNKLGGIVSLLRFSINV